MMFSVPNSDNSDCDYVHMWVLHRLVLQLGSASETLDLNQLF